MTIRDAFLGVIQFEVSDEIVDMALIDADFTGSEVYTKADRQVLEIAAIDVLMSLLVTKEEREGQLTITRDIEGIKAYVLYLARKNGLEEIVDELSGVPKITSVKMW